ncbi:hypothetical protein BB561_001959 [Smittium simulii]|uniref:UBC core domain-containing protein n=1 Tax=Smittium simulii TaxID=133385 RepID=A0A2T9YSD4_9FUNG|nr:hypothetical protein BB561_001959 [Smittium simulii]
MTERKKTMRLKRELEALTLRPPKYICLRSVDSLLNWKIEISGADGTLYEGETFILQLSFANTYPYEAPDELPVNDSKYIRFATSSAKDTHWAYHDDSI